MGQMVIKNGRLVDPLNHLNMIADVTIRDGKITSVLPAASGRENDAADTVCIDASGMILAAGLMDAHVHFRDPGFTEKEDLMTGSAAAARGGITRVVCMANTRPVVDNLFTLHDILSRAEASPVRILQTASVTRGLRGRELTDMELLAEHGAAGFTDDGIPIMDEKLLLEAMQRAKKLSLPISLHEEDPAYISGAGVNAGEVAEQIGYGGASPLAEEVMVLRDCGLALKTGARVCIQHISSAKSVELVRIAKRMGADIHAEATPHHFTLTQEAVLKYGTNARMNPPLRTEKDRQGIIEGLCDGTIDMIVTDHAPHTAAEKARPMAQAPSGITGLETSLALGVQQLVRPGYLTMEQLIEKMTVNPAAFYGLDYRGFAEGADADITIFAEDEEWTVDHFASKASNSPFAGWTLPARVHYTICRGKIVYKG